MNTDDAAILDGAAWAAPSVRVVPAVLGARTGATGHSDPPTGRLPAFTASRPAPRPVRVFLSRSVFGLPLTIGQVAAWQLALTMIGTTVGRPQPIAVPVMACAAVVLALTVLRLRGRWLYQWVTHYGRFRRRERNRLLPREDGTRAVLHFFAPDTMVMSVRLGARDLAVLNRPRGAAAVLRIEPPRAGPVTTLPRPVQLLDGAEALTDIAAQVVLHGVSGRRHRPVAWLAVQAVRADELSEEEDELTETLSTGTRWLLDRLAEHGVLATVLDRAETLRTVVGLAHVSADRRVVRERWRTWRCGPVVQAAFRLRGWATLPDQRCRQLLERLLTVSTGGVVTVSLAATGGGAETATVRVAAPGRGELTGSVRRLGALAGEHGVRLVRLDGEHADGVASVLPLGAVR